MLVISCYIMVLFLFFGTCLFCYSYLHLLIRKFPRSSVEPPREGSSVIQTEAYSIGVLVLESTTIPLMV